MISLHKSYGRESEVMIIKRNNDNYHSANKDND